MTDHDRALMMETLKCGANQGALRIMSKRVEENVARAILRDMHSEGIIAVRKDLWDEARHLVDAMNRALRVRD